MNDHEKITTTTVWMTNFTLLVWLDNRQKNMIEKKTEERKTETEKKITWQKWLCTTMYVRCAKKILS